MPVQFSGFTAFVRRNTLRATACSTSSTTSTGKPWQSISICRCHPSGSCEPWTRSSNGAASRWLFVAISARNTSAAPSSLGQHGRDHIQPGNPEQNAYIERYKRTVRYDWLSHYLFESIEEVQNYMTDWMWTYNHERPNMALGGITPKQKSALLTHPTSDRC